MRKFAPGGAIIYLETKDLGKMLASLTENKNFQQTALPAPDFSPLENAQAAIVVSGFKASEKSLAGDAAALNFKPQFVLIADTHSWERTNLALIENQFGKFVENTYGANAKPEKSVKGEARFFVWSLAENRRIYAAVAGSFIYIGNQESLIDNCLAVKRGEAENLLKNENLVKALEKGGAEKIAFGYISAAGIAQLADFAGVSVAVEAAEEDLSKSFIARILPQIARETVQEATWTATRSERGIEDRIYIKPAARIAGVWKETLVPAADNQFRAAEYLPADFDSVTRYNLQNPQIAWRSVQLGLSGKLDARDGKIWSLVAGGFFAPYGIIDAETFLGGIDSEIVTARLASDSDESVALLEVRDEARVKSAIAGEINFSQPPAQIGAAKIWQSADSETTAALIEGRLLLGSRRDVLNCLRAKESGQNLTKTSFYQQLTQTNALTKTIGAETETNAKIAAVLSGSRPKKTIKSFYATETRYNSNGIERRTVSDFGLIGALIAQFSKEQ